MLKVKALLLAGVLFSCSIAFALEDEGEELTPGASFPVKDRDPSNPFGKVKTPTRGEVKVIGGYSAGCIAGAEKMSISGPGWEIVRVSRNRMYGHPILISLLKRAAETLGPDSSPMIVGDMSQPRGGPMTSGHTSHQMGLDVDIWFQSLPRGTKMTDKLRETIPLVSVLGRDYKSVDPKKWNKQFEQLMLWFAEQPEVDRIFVNAAIKKMLCAAYPDDIRLKKLRPWYGHNEHFHVRLACPAGQEACVPQKPVEGIDCEDDKFAYWLSDSVIDDLKNPKPPRPAKIVKLPIECKAVVRAP